jgi:hypothetical protein
MQSMRTPESNLAASTKPGLAGPIVLALLWFVLGAPIFIIILGALTGSLGNEGAVLLFILIAYGGGVIGLGVVINSRRGWSKHNDLDYSVSEAIAQRLSNIDGRNEPLSDRSSGMRIIQGTTVGEISQHFDQRLSASVSGWLHHGWASTAGGRRVSRTGRAQRRQGRHQRRIERLARRLGGDPRQSPW